MDNIYYPQGNYCNKNKKKIISFLLFIFSLSILPNNTYAQNKETAVSLSVTNQDIRSIFDDIESKTVYRFTYIDGTLSPAKNVTISANKMGIEQFLNKILSKTSLTYNREGNTFSIITKLDKDTPQKKIAVKGNVVDESGEPLIGVVVAVKNSSAATVTDIDGLFTLNCPVNSVLTVSYLGYLSQEVKVSASTTNLNVKLLQDNKVLDEVVVVGYGVQKRSNVTGSVTSIKTSDFKDLNMDITSAIQGRVSGVNVSNGSIIVRGAASVNGSDPLWIVDGVPGGAPNMNDVESLEILKDAASTSIYGARGAGGVILVTTKKGSAGKTTVNAKINIGAGFAIDIPKLLQTNDYIDRKIAAGFVNNPASGWDNPSALPNTNWDDYVWRNSALKQNYFVQMTGGADVTTYNTSAEFIRNERIEKGAYDLAGNLRYSGQTKFGKKFKVTEILTLGFTNIKPSVYGDPATNKIYYRQVPTMTPYDNENVSGGGWGKQPAGGYYEGPNPVCLVESVHENHRKYKGGASLIFDWEIIDNLSFQANFSGNFNSYGNNKFQEYWSTGNMTQEQRYSKDYGESYDLRMLYTLTYSKTLADKHFVKGLLGYEAYKTESSSAGGWKTGFSVEPVEEMSLGSGATEALGGKGLGRSLSQFARLNYAYDNKYLLEASIRRDGYDNFGAENRFGLFPSASAGWNITEESFIKNNSNIKWLSQLKLRASIGRIGNNTVPQFLYEPSYTSNYLYYSYDSKVTSRGFWFSNIPNANVKWEDVTQWNIGLDASFLNNRLNATVEYYDKKTTDMLYTIGAPPSSGSYNTDIFGKIPSYVANIGEISNKGFELMVQWRDSYRDFKYDVAMTLSTNKNKVVKLSDQINPVIWKGSSTAINSSIYRTENGQPMGQMYGYVVDGIFQSQSEVDALNAGSKDGVYQQAGTSAGDLKYRDVNKDGKITNEDKTYIGDPWPDLISGLNINVSWKGFDLGMGWTANLGMDIFNSTKAYERNFYGDFNTTYKVFDAWTPENKSTTNPRVINTDPNNNFKNVSSYFVENGSFLKLNNLHFGYNLPKSLLASFRIQALKVYINCDNMITFTKFQGDPEIGGGYLERNHYAEKRYPKTWSLMGGLSLTL